MNIYTVGRATQGLADYLNAENPTVAIARDSRNKGELFVKTRGRHLCCRQRRHRLPLSQDFAVPALSWRCATLVLWRHLRDGQPQPRPVQRLQGLRPRRLPDHPRPPMPSLLPSREDMFDGIKSMDFDEAVAAGKIEWIGDECLARFTTRWSRSPFATSGNRRRRAAQARLHAAQRHRPYARHDGARQAWASPTSPWCPSRRTRTATSPPARTPTPRSARPCRRAWTCARRSSPT